MAGKTTGRPTPSEGASTKGTPAARGEPALEHPSSENARTPHHTWRILFLADANHIAQLKEAGTDAGYVVVGAATIKEAWAFLDGKNHADVIVCAAYLEEGSAFDFLKGVRDSELHRSSMFLMLSLEPSATAAQLDRSTKRAAMALGADGYVIMPAFDPDELVAQIQKVQPIVPMLQQSATAEEKRKAE